MPVPPPSSSSACSGCNGSATIRAHRIGSRLCTASKAAARPRGPRPVRARRPAARLGAGGTHHVAFRAPSLEDVDRYAALVAERRLPSSGVIDRTFFHNLYFREPGGALFEIAADVPGRSPYPSDAEIGTTLVLPDHLEPHRAEIERSLHPIEGIAA